MSSHSSQNQSIHIQSPLDKKIARKSKGLDLYFSVTTLAGGAEISTGNKSACQFCAQQCQIVDQDTTKKLRNTFLTDVYDLASDSIRIPIMSNEEFGAHILQSKYSKYLVESFDPLDPDQINECRKRLVRWQQAQ